MPSKKTPPKLEQTALMITRGIGSPLSIVLHTIAFIVCLLAPLFGFIEWSSMLLILTTIVSLEAIYLSLFIQMTVNFQAEDIDEIQEDIDEMQEDVEEIQEDVDELQEDVEEIEESDTADEERDMAQQKALATIQTDLRKLMDDITRLQHK